MTLRETWKFEWTHKSRTHFQHDSITDVICHSLVVSLLRATKNAACTLSRAAQLPWESTSNYFTIQTAGSRAVKITAKLCVLFTNTVKQNHWFAAGGLTGDGETRPQQHWWRITSLKRWRAENRSRWAKLGSSWAPRGKPCSWAKFCCVTTPAISESEQNTCFNKNDFCWVWIHQCFLRKTV